MTVEGRLHGVRTPESEHAGNHPADRGSPRGAVPPCAARESSRGRAPPFSRIAYAAAHVVADPLAAVDPWLSSAIDWDRTIAYRRYLWSLGLGVAEAMDTAQRGMGLDWPASLELIRRSVAAAREIPGAMLALRRRHRPTGARARRHHRRRDPRLRRTMRGGRGAAAAASS